MKKGEKRKIEPCLCDICGRQFNYRSALGFHKAVKHEGKQYPQLWRRGHITWNKGLKGIHFSPETEFKEGLLGDKNPNWKGGKVKAKGGYTLIYKPGHHRISHGFYVYEHIVVWEEANKILLPNGYVVHHLNGVKDDNRPENLIALPIKQHHSKMLLSAIRKRLRELELKLAQQRLL